MKLILLEEFKKDFKAMELLNESPSDTNDKQINEVTLKMFRIVWKDFFLETFELEDKYEEWCIELASEGDTGMSAEDADDGEMFFNFVKDHKEVLYEKNLSDM